MKSGAHCKVSEFQGAVVQYYGSSQDVLIRLAPREDLNSAEISNKILGLLENDGQQIEMRRVEFVGAQVGQELTESGGLAMPVCLVRDSSLCRLSVSDPVCTQRNCCTGA